MLEGGEALATPGVSRLTVRPASSQACPEPRMHRYQPSQPYAHAVAPERDRQDARLLRVPQRFHDDDYERPVRSRYVDPVEVVWLATARRLALTVRRDPSIFSRTDGQGLLALGPRSTLDADDCLAQMILHEICHWITNGVDTWHDRDWAFELDGEVDVREHACLRLQCWLGQRWGMREMFGPTGGYRQYYDQLPLDPLAPIDDSEWEAAAVRIGEQAVWRAQQLPWWPALSAAMEATRAARDLLQPFAGDYQSEQEGDELPLWWEQRHACER